MGRGTGSPSSRDLAREAGVSQSTVSRFLNNDSRVSERAGQHIEAAMTKLGYTRNAAARTLITGHSKLIGLVVSNITNPFYPELIEAIVGTAAENDYNVILCSTQENPALQLQYLQLMIEHQVDGVILTSTLFGSEEAMMRRMRAPLVQVNRIVDGLPTDTVQLDNVKAGQLATEHLFSLGHSRIGYIGGNAQTSTNANRFAGYRAAVERRGETVDEGRVRHGQFTYDSGYQLALEIFDQPAGSTALVCGDDLVAMGVMDAAMDTGLRVPEDMAVVGFDDVPAASLRPIGLTTIRQPAAEMGRRAVNLVLERILGDADRELVDVLLRPKLVIRRTCGGVPGEPVRDSSLSSDGS